MVLGPMADKGSLSKRLERGRFAWPSAGEGKVSLTSAQAAMLLDHACRCPS